MSNLEKRLSRLEEKAGGIPKAAIFLVYNEREGKTIHEAIGEHCTHHNITRDDFKRYGAPIISFVTARMDGESGNEQH